MTDLQQEWDTALEWRAGGVPVSRRFDDPYFSQADGLAETRHVFLSGNDLPARFRPGFHVAELGFGTGLNLVATLMAWRAAGMTDVLRFTSFEAFPLSAGDMARALAAFPQAREAVLPLLAQWGDGARRLRLPDLDAEVIIGDARETLPAWEGRADAWYLDGFAPARNPEMWEPALLAAVAAHTVPGGTAATYSAAGAVRAGLAAAGFTVTRVPGFGAKRHMTTAVLDRAA